MKWCLELDYIYCDCGYLRYLGCSGSWSGSLLMKDFIGTEVGVGDTIVYATRQFSSIYMHKAVVKQITTHQKWSSDVQYLRVEKDLAVDSSHFATNKIVTLTNPNFVIVEKAKKRFDSISPPLSELPQRVHDSIIN